MPSETIIEKPIIPALIQIVQKHELPAYVLEMCTTTLQQLIDKDAHLSIVIVKEVQPPPSPPEFITNPIPSVYFSIPIPIPIPSLVTSGHCGGIDGSDGAFRFAVPK